MKKNIISVDDFYIKANVAKNVCPLDWLAKYYRQYPGKLVMLDKNLLNYLLNNSHADQITEENSHHKQTFTIVWNATQDYPETKVVVSNYGEEKIEKDEVEGEYLVESDTNWYVIDQLYAEDILSDGKQYASNMKDDRQVIYLVNNDLQKQPEHNV